MKKNFTLAIFCLLISFTLSAQQPTLSLTGVTTGTHFYYCQTTTTSVVVYKPAGAGIGSWYHPGVGDITQDSMIITPATQGYWNWDDGTAIEFYINFISISPTESWTATDTTKCTESSVVLKGQDTHQADFRYLWSTTSTASQISVSTPGIITVTVMGACDTITDQIEVLNYPIPAPDLGLDTVTCYTTTVTLDPGISNITTYQWSTGATTSTLTVDTTGTYWVRVIDNNGCIGRDTVQVTTSIPTEAPICYVEFDTLTWKNNINWSINLPGNADSVRVYKETSLGIWILIGTVHKSIDHMLDTTSLPQSQSYSYRIAIVDTCGNESVLSSFHTTINLLSAYDQPSNTYGFTWSAYHGLIVNDYYLYGIDASNVATQIASVAGNVFMYNYVNPNMLFIKYFIGFEAPDCDAKTNVIVKSNWVQSVLSSINEVSAVKFSIYPNPSTGVFTVKGNGIVYIYDVIGKCISTQTIYDKEIFTLISGIYMVKFIDHNNNLYTKKVVIQ